MSHESQKPAHAFPGNPRVTTAELFMGYGSDRKDYRNSICHAFGIPLIALGIMGLAPQLRLSLVDSVVVAAVGVLVYYAACDLRGALLSFIEAGRSASFCPRTDLPANPREIAALQLTTSLLRGSLI